jgi:hypothetical protein
MRELTVERITNVKDCGGFWPCYVGGFRPK